jgi:O-antigen/teichoic acid export membrane protein
MSSIKKESRKAAKLARAEAREVRGILGRIRRRDFKGNAGQAIKNSTYNLMALIIGKGGSFIFTILLARILLPEKFGIYSLALGTYAIVGGFAELGISTALITFVSGALGEKKLSRAKAYFNELGRLRRILTLIVTIVFLASSYFIATFYGKPIFFALLVGVLYVPLISLNTFLEQNFRAANSFKETFSKEIIFQAARFLIVPVLALLLIKTNFSNHSVVVSVLLSIVLSHLIATFYLLARTKRLKFIKSKTEQLSKKESKDLKRFIVPLSVVFLSGIFFGYVDTVMLGRFVTESFIAYYSAAFSLIGSAGSILGFAATAILPILTTLRDKKAVERAFNKTLRVSLLIFIPLAILLYFAASLIILITYGPSYSDSIILLRWFSILLIFLPLINLYNTYFISQKKTGEIAILLVVSTVINILLNYTLITAGLRLSLLAAVKGACLATIISKGIYLGGLIILRKFN